MFSCDVLTTAGQTRITVRGVLDLASANRLWQVLRPHLTSGAQVLLICSEISSIDAMGLGILGLARERAEEYGATLTLATPSPALREALDMGGVADKFATIADPAAPLGHEP